MSESIMVPLEWYVEVSERSATLQVLLEEIVTHLAHDAGVNGSKFTDDPRGSIRLSETPGSLWQRMNALNAKMLKLREALDETHS